MLTESSAFFSLRSLCNEREDQSIAYCDLLFTKDRCCSRENGSIVQHVLFSCVDKWHRHSSHDVKMRKRGKNNQYDCELSHRVLRSSRCHVKTSSDRVPSICSGVDEDARKRKTRSDDVAVSASERMGKRNERETLGHRVRQIRDINTVQEER